MVANKKGKPFDKEEYYKYPDRFEPIFHSKYLPYISAIFHNMYWDQRFPRLISSQ
jgi:alpha-aminoadipic semialdehyde synthase